MLHSPSPTPQHPSRKQRSSWTNNVSVFVWSWRHLSFTFPGAHGLPPPTSQPQASPPQGCQGLSPTFTTCATTCVPADPSSLAHPSSSLAPPTSHSCRRLFRQSHWTRGRLLAAAKGPPPSSTWESRPPSPNSSDCMPVPTRPPSPRGENQGP